MVAVLIDLDGTILDVRARHVAVYTRTLTEMGHEPLAANEYWRRRRAGESTQELLTGLTDADRGSFSRLWVNRIESEWALEFDRLFAGALQALRDVGVRHELVLVTLRRDREALVRQLERLSMLTLFQGIYSSGPRAGVRKHLLGGVDRLRDGGYVVGDTEEDVEFAAKTGRRSIAVANGVRTARFLARRGAGVVIESVRDLPTAIAGAERSGEVSKPAAARDFVLARHLYDSAGL